VLRGADLVTTQRRVTWIDYQLNRDRLALLRSLLPERIRD